MINEEEEKAKEFWINLDYNDIKIHQIEEKCFSVKKFWKEGHKFQRDSVLSYSKSEQLSYGQVINIIKIKDEKTTLFLEIAEMAVQQTKILTGKFTGTTIISLKPTCNKRVITHSTIKWLRGCFLPNGDYLFEQDPLFFWYNCLVVAWHQKINLNKPQKTKRKYSDDSSIVC